MKTETWIVRTGQMLIVLMMLVRGGARLHAQLALQTGTLADAPKTTLPIRVFGEVSSSDTGEIPHPQSQWFRVASPSNGQLQLNFNEAQWSDAIRVVVYLEGLESGERVQTAVRHLFRCSPGTNTAFGCSISIRGQSNYLVRISSPFRFGEADTHSVATRNAFSLEVAFLPHAAHDAYAGAEELTGASFSFVADNRSASREDGESPLESWSYGGSLWYRWTAPSSGWLEVSASVPKSFSPVVSRTNPPIWLDPLEMLATGQGLLAGDYWLPARSSGSTSSGSFTLNSTGFAPLSLCPANVPLIGIGLEATVVSQHQWISRGTNAACRVEQGATYRIAVDSTAQPGSWPIHVQFTPSPQNDLFEQRAVLSGFSATGTGHTAGASISGSELQVASIGSPPRHPSVVWWSWTATAEGPVQVLVLAPGRRATVSIWTGEDPERLRHVAGFPVIEERDQAWHAEFYAWPGVSYSASVSVYGDASSLNGAVYENEFLAPDSYTIELRQLPARLRPVVAGGGGLVFAAEKPGIVIAQNALVSRRWSSSGIFNFPTNAHGAAVAYMAPQASATNPADSGLFRVWLVDVPALPEPAVVYDKFLRDGELGADFHFRGYAGETTIVESSRDLLNWSRHSVQTPEGSTLIQSVPSASGQAFFRARSLRQQIRPLIAQGPN